MQSPIFVAVLESMAEASRVKSVEDLHAVFRPLFSQLRLLLWFCIEVTVSSSPTAQPLFGEHFERWWRYYSEMNYLTIDPLMQAALAGRDGFFWSDLLAEIASAPYGEQISNDARRFGLENGFVNPLYQSGDSAFIVVFAGSPDSKPDHSLRAAIHLVATYYGLLGLRLLTGRIPDVMPTKLTNRQLECLRWVREGKSSHDIADILGISSDVVDEHIARACNRLGVRTRTQAAVVATIKGYL